MNRENIIIRQNRNESGNICVSRYDVSLSASGFTTGRVLSGHRHRWQEQMNPAPQGAMQVQDCVQDEEL